MNATYMDGKIAKHLKAMSKTSRLKFALINDGKFMSKDGCKYRAPWKN